MPSNRIGASLGSIRTLFTAGTVVGLADGQLLERFATADGEAAGLAFAALVERHGPMVFRVCRGVLRDVHDAEDAFQATFLILTQKAASIRSGDSLASWLHGVAYNVASTARSAAARRRFHESKAGATRPQTTAQDARDDPGPVLHEELGRLPKRYRAAIVLCCLEGLTQQQAAEQLGWPLGTVQSRLARGRQRLQARLARRGLAPSTGAVAALLASGAANAGVPAALVEATVRAATLTAAGQTIAGAVSVTALSGVVLRAMFMTRFKLISAALLVIGAGAGGTAVLALQQAEPPPAGAKANHKLGGPASPSAAEAQRPAAKPTPDASNDIDPQISLVEAELKRAHDRYVWTLRMNVKGDASLTESLKAKEEVGQAMIALERAWAKRRPQGQGQRPENKTPEERKRDEVKLLVKEIERAQAENRWHQMRLQRARRFESGKAPLRDKIPDPVSDAEWKLAKAVVAAATADLELNVAELKLLELRLSQMKQ